MFSQYLLAAAVGSAVAETGIQGWLRYARLPASVTHEHFHAVPTSVIVLHASPGSPLFSAETELRNGVDGMLGIDLKPGDARDACHASNTIVVATQESYETLCGAHARKYDLEEDGFWLNSDHNSVQIIGQNERGALYGAFEYLSLLGQGDFAVRDEVTNPSAPLRWANQWDNLNSSDGSIERGYGGVSIFFDGFGHVRDDLSRVPLYGRLLASVRINALVINNVNADPTILTDDNLQGVKMIADLLRPWGVQVGLSLDFASPQDLGELGTYDPLAPSVIKWWDDKTDQIYGLVPDMAGYLVKADSEGQPGPLVYNRTLAQGANLFANAIRPYGGVVMFRSFVYNSLNASDWYADRAKAAVDYFKDLDGQFEDNVVIQIKYGPLDFQVREAASPLFANMPNSNMAIEFEISQEYLGQQSHLVYLPPLWQTILGFDMRVDGKMSLVRDIVTGHVFDRKLGGYAGVINVGMNQTWLGSHLAMSNFYAFGRLAWDPTLDSADILQEWTSLTFGLDENVRDVVVDMSMSSWQAFENYSGNLGITTLSDTYLHYSFNPAARDDSSTAGIWTRAYQDSVGMDRTSWNGTGYSAQYPPEVDDAFEHTDTTPDDLMLWFHHVPYTFKLHSGRTVIQTFYDDHYAGAETANSYHGMWGSLRGKIDEERFNEVLYMLEYQAGHSIAWRDGINEYFRNLSGIPDKRNRVRNHPWRLEAEDMDLDGYAVVDVEPPVAASGYKAIVTNGTGTASGKLDFPDGTYDLAVNYYDVIGGQATYEAWINDDLVAQWVGDSEDMLAHDFSVYVDSHSAIRKTFEGIRIARGDRITIKGTADGIEQAPLDYISLLPPGIID